VVADDPLSHSLRRVGHLSSSGPIRGMPDEKNGINICQFHSRADSSGTADVVHDQVFARGGSIEVPENVGAKESVNGRECNQGHRVVNGSCTVVKVPVNA